MFELLNDRYNTLINYILNFNIILFNENITNLKIYFLIFLNLLCFVLIKNLIKNIIYKNPLLNIIFEFPGTVFHEVSHLLTALLTFSKIIKFNLIPKITKNNQYINIIYGSVEYKVKNNFFNIFIGSSPLFLNLFLFLFILNLFKLEYKVLNFQNFILSYLTMVIIYSSLLSFQDIKTIFKGVLTIEFILFLFLILFSIIYFENYYYIFFNEITLNLNNFMLLFINSLLLIIFLLIYIVLSLIL